MRQVIAIGLWLLLAPFAVVAQAQNEPPLVLVSDGNFFVWDDLSQPPVELRCGLQAGEQLNGLVLSPVGTHVAMLVNPALSEAAQAFWNNIVEPIPTDIRVCDLSTGAMLNVAGQPDDFDPDTGLPAVANLFSSWSPDGRQLAYNRDGYELHIYDLASGETRLLRSNLSVYANSLIIFAWGENGLASIEQEPEASYVRLTDTQTGAIIWEQPLASGVVVEQVEWTRHEDKPTISAKCHGADFNYHLVDPADGRPYQPFDHKEWFTDETGRLSITIHETWQVYDRQTQTVLEISDRTGAAALSPEGNRLAYLSGGAVMLWDNGNIRAVPMPPQPLDRISYLLWGDLRWKPIITSPVDAEAASHLCGVFARG